MDGAKCSGEGCPDRKALKCLRFVTPTAGHQPWILPEWNSETQKCDNFFPAGKEGKQT